MNAPSLVDVCTQQLRNRSCNNTLSWHFYYEVSLLRWTLLLMCCPHHTMSVVTTAVASRPSVVQETCLLYSIFLLSCQNSGPLLSCTNATTARCCCLMPTCLFDNWYYKVDLCLWRFPWRSGSPCLPWDCTSPFASLFRMANLFLRHHSKLPTLRLTKSLGYLWIYLLLWDLNIS